MPTELSIVRESFEAFGRSSPDIQHEVVIALQKPNVDKVEAILLERATPGHPLYQQWLSREEIDALVSPTEEAFSQVRSWLDSESITVTWVSRRRDYIRASSSVRHWERLLKAEFLQYRDHSQETSRSHSSSGFVSSNVYHRATHYTIPTHLQNHISSIFNTVQIPPPHQTNNFRLLDSKSRRTVQGLRRNSLESSYMETLPLDNIRNLKSPTVVTGRALGTGKRLRTSVPEMTTSASVSPLTPISGGSDGVGRAVVPSFLRETYGIPADLTGDSRLRQSVFQTNSEYFSTNDLALFQRRNNLTQQTVQSIGNHDRADCPRLGQLSSVSCSEGNLDLQYIMGLAPNTTTVFWYVAPSPVEDPFLSWILAVANDPSPPTSNSISWGTLEQLESASVMNAFNTEAMLLSAQGVTIVAASGDHGAANQGRTLTGQQLCLCDMDSSSSELPWMTANDESTPAFTESWAGKGYFPTFPATSPYVTAVGATMGPELGKPEVACQSQAGGVITSGGGFSTFFARPTWQDTAVSRYFETLTANTATTPTQGYNRYGRGYPDLAFLGVEYEVIIAQETQWLYGTSTVAPVLAGLVSLVNAERLRRGQSTIGWINPTLYQAGTQNKYQTSSSNGNHNFSSSLGHVRFNDVTQGHNRCCASTSRSSAANAQPVCCQGGFRAVCGWDAVSGWGSMTFRNFTALFEDDYSTVQSSRKLTSANAQSYHDLFHEMNQNGAYSNITGRDVCPPVVTDNRIDDTTAKSSGAQRGTGSQTAIIVATSLIGVFFFVVAIACLVSCCSKHSAYRSRRRRYQDGRTVGTSSAVSGGAVGPLNNTSATGSTPDSNGISSEQQPPGPPGVNGRYFLRPARFRRHYHQRYLNQHQSILSCDEDVRRHDDIHYDFDYQHSLSGGDEPSSPGSSFCDEREEGNRVVNGRQRERREVHQSPDRDSEGKDADGEGQDEDPEGDASDHGSDRNGDTRTAVRSASRTRRATRAGHSSIPTSVDDSNEDTDDDEETGRTARTSAARTRKASRKSRGRRSSSPAASELTAVTPSPDVNRLVPVVHAVPVIFCNTMSHGRNSSFVSSSLSPYASAEVTFVLDRAPPLAPPPPTSLIHETVLEEDADLGGEEQKR